MSGPARTQSTGIPGEGPAALETNAVLPNPGTFLRLRALLESSLHTNSIYLILANVANVFFGFLFWTLAAHLYRPYDVGLGAAGISAIGLLVMLASLGMDQALVRFLPEAARPEVVTGSSLLVGSGAALAASAAFVAGLSLWSPALLPLRTSGVVVTALLVAVVGTTVSTLGMGVFLAERRASLVVIQAVLFGVTKVLAVVTIARIGGAAALVEAWALGTTVAAAFSVWLLFRRGSHGAPRARLVLDPALIRRMAGFSFANFVTSVLATAPNYLLPLLIVTLSTPEANAYFYMAFAMSALLKMIPTAVALSLFAHGSSATRALVPLVRESLWLTLGLLAPALVIVWLFGRQLLLLFGHSYSAEATPLLWLLALSTVPLGVQTLFFAVRKVQQRMHGFVVAMAWILLVTLGLSALLLPRLGVTGVGVAWLIAQTSVAAALLARYGRYWRWVLPHGSV